MNRYLAQEKRVFDISKVTVVGSPTITSDGVASGFSTSNYLTKSNAVTIGSSGEFHIDFEFDCTLHTDNQYIFDLYNTISNEITLRREGNFYRVVSFVNGTAIFNNAVVVQTGALHIKGFFEYKNGVYTLDINGVQQQLNSTTKMNALTYNLSLGARVASGSVLQPLTNGSINLPSFKIYVDNQLVFQPVKPVHLLERRKEGFDLSKFTVVGNPTITEYGVASGFSSSNYVQVGKNLSDNWGFILPVQITNDTTSLQGIARFYSLSGEVVCQIRKEGARVYISGFGGAVGNFAFNPTYTLNETLYLKAVKQGNTLTLSYSNDLIGWNDKTFDLTGYTIPDVSRIVLGIANPSWVGLQGSIDLTQFSITVADKEVFTGAKESYYVLRR